MSLLFVYLAIAIGISFLCSILESVLLSITPSYVENTVSVHPRAGKRLTRVKDRLDESLSAILILNTFAHTMGAYRGLEVLAVTVVDERVQPFHRFNPDVAAAAAVSSIGAAEFNVFLTPKGDATGTAVARLHIDLGFIEKFHLSQMLYGRPLHGSPNRSMQTIEHAICLIYLLSGFSHFLRQSGR